MTQLLANKVAIVTGGASGIGRTTVELLGEKAAKVVIADIDAERGAPLAKQFGEAAAFKKTDVAKANQIQELVDFAIDHFVHIAGLLLLAMSPL